MLAVGCARVGAYRPSATQRATIRAELEAMLHRSAAAWNRGDLDGFMSDYLPGDSTTYIGGRGLVRGPAAIRPSYARLFTGEAQRDSLSFSFETATATDRMSRQHALVAAYTPACHS